MKIDFLDEGQGNVVLLLHSTAAGNKQWRKLIECLSPNYRVLAPNLFGYGATPTRIPGTMPARNNAATLSPIT